MPDAQFESTFANLANAQLEKLRAIKEFKVGFQTIEKNDDETKAVGVFGFQVGNQMIYAPVFFDNGEIKGSELLYLQDQNIFVPSQENWVNYLINRKPYMLGEQEEQSIGELGIMPPDLSIFRGSPVKSGHSLKEAAERVDSFARPFLNVFTMTSKEFEDKYKEASQRTELMTFVRDVGAPAAKKLLEMMEGSTKFANAVLKFHSMEEIKQAVQDVMRIAGPKLDLPKTAADGDDKIEGTAPDVVVVMHGDEDLAGEMDILTDSEKERLLQDQIVVRDNRDEGEASNVYKATFGKSLTNPCETGLYEILLRPNRFRRCFVLYGPKKFSEQGDEPSSLIISEDDNAYCNAEPHSVFSKKRCDLEFDEAFDELPDADSMKEKKYYALIGPKGSSTVPFRVINRVSDSAGVVRLCVDPHERITHRGSFVGREHRMSLPPNASVEYCESPEPCDRSVEDEVPMEYDPEKEKKRCKGYHITLTGKDGLSLNYMNGEMFVPNGYKAIAITSEYSTLNPGNAADVEMEIMKSAALAGADPEIGEVKVHNDGVYFHISTNGLRWKGFSKRAAAGRLVISQGVTFDAAKAMLNIPNKSTTRFLVKYAQGYPQMGPGPSTPGFQEPSVAYDPVMRAPAQPPLTYTQPIPGMLPPPTSEQEHQFMIQQYQPPKGPEVGGDSAMIAENAAATGQKEIFDTSAVGSLVRSVDTEHVVDRYLGDLIQALDRIGRILFLLYWHDEAFKERYGEQDVPELEDNLRNVFKNLGDLVLFLKQKTVEPEPLETAEAELEELPSS